MKWRALRKLAKNGNSLTVALPRQVIHGMRLLRGDGLRLVFDDREETLIITREARHDFQPDPLEHDGGMVAMRGQS